MKQELTKEIVTLLSHHHHHHHQQQGLDPLIRSVSRVTAARANASSVFQFFSIVVVCSAMIPKGFGFVAFFASVGASFVCIHLSCLVCLNPQFATYVVICFVAIQGVACHRSQQCYCLPQIIYRGLAGQSSGHQGVSQ